MLVVRIHRPGAGPDSLGWWSYRESLADFSLHEYPCYCEAPYYLTRLDTEIRLANARPNHQKYLDRETAPIVALRAGDAPALKPGRFGIFSRNAPEIVELTAGGARPAHRFILKHEGRSV